MWISIVVFGIGLTQISFFHVKNFVSKKVQHYRLIYKSLGYWVESNSEGQEREQKKGEIFEWSEEMDPKLLEKRFIVIFKGQVYLKILQNSSYFMINNKQASFVDIVILVILKGII